MSHLLPQAPMHLLSLLPLLALLAWAAQLDWRTRKIPNWLTFSLLAAGISRAIYLGVAGEALLGALTGFGLLLPLFVLGAMGAGDVKLMTATGMWLGPAGVASVFIVAAVVGVVLIVGQCLVKGRLVELFRNTGVLLMSLVHIRRVGAQQAAANGRRFTTIDKPLPYAVPVLAAFIFAVASGRC